jgi:hypothetical protein
MLTKRQNRWLVIGVLAEMALMIAAGIIMGLPSMARGEELPKHPFTVISDQPDRVKMFYFMAKGDKASTAELKVAEALAKKYNWDMTTYDVLGSTGDASVKASFKVRGVPTFVFKRLGPDGWMRSKDDWLAVEGAVPMEEVVKILEKKNFIPSPPASAEAEPKQAPPAVAYTPEKDLPGEAIRSGRQGLSAHHRQQPEARLRQADRVVLLRRHAGHGDDLRLAGFVGIERPAQTRSPNR